MNLRSISKAVAVAAAFALIVSNPLNTLANTTGNEKSARLNDEQVSVQYAGTRNNNFAFSVQFENATGQKFQLIVKNDDGDVVYQEQYNDVHFAKTILLPKDLGEIHPTIIIRTGNQQVEHSFVANTKFTENIVVTKL